MKDLKKSLEKLASDLMKVAQKAEEITAKLDTQAKSPPKQAAAKAKPAKTIVKKVSKKPAQPTAADTVYKVIARYKKGADVKRIKLKTAYDTKKIQNIVYKLKKQDKIKSETKGVYMKA
jgi:predicted Rossmann fold nucleotide-binding protein DprA/Smf involved in DNA uptake